uniref:Thioredoxin n=1 Tax=Panagrolaimus sp. PS1159 TaxID=55785 RepID=A0AC35FW81_9BILA
MPVAEYALKDEFDEALKAAGNKLVVVDFFATWCGPCKIMGPKFHKMSDEFTNVIFIKVDVDEGEEIVQNYEVRVMPTFCFIKNGETIYTFEGNNPDGLKEAIQQRA